KSSALAAAPALAPAAPSPALESAVPPQSPSPKAPPSLGASFLGLPDDTTSIPPDTMGAVGPNHVMTTLNSQVRIQTRAGANLSTVTLGLFWQTTGAMQ